MSLISDTTNLHLNAAGGVTSMTLTNTGTATLLVKIWAACVGNRSPAGVTLPEGLEAVSERWIEAREEGEEWQVVGFPGIFPARFEDLIDGVLTLTIGAGASKTVEFRLAVPADAASSGVVNAEIVVRAING